MNKSSYNISDATICWNCAKATGHCSWSENLVPVKGWTAEETKESYVVRACPLFEQDAMNFGLIRVKK